VYTTKLPRLSFYLLEEFCLRSNLHDGKSGYNEEIQKFLKAADKKTNKKRGLFVEHVVVNEAVALVLKEDQENEANEQQEQDEDLSTASSRYDSDAPRRRRQRRRIQKRRKFSKKKSLAHLESSRAAPGIAAVLRDNTELDRESG